MWRTLTIARFSALLAGLADGNSAERQATGKPLDLRSLFPLPLIAECTQGPGSETHRLDTREANWQNTSNWNRRSPSGDAVGLAQRGA